MRSLLRWLRRLALTAVALAAIALAAVLITAHTGWGREQLRRGVEAALGDAFPGGARIAGLDGSVLGTLTLHGVEIDGPDHRPLVTAGTVRVAVALWPLAIRTARIDRLIADDVRAYVRDAPVPVAPPPGRAAAASPWQIELPELAVHRAQVEIERGRITLGELEVTAAVTVAAGRVTIDGAANGRWSRAGGPAVPLTARGGVVLDGAVRIPAAHVVLGGGAGGAAIDASALGLDPAHPSGVVTVAAPADAIARLAPELGGAVPGAVRASIELAPDGPATRLVVHATAGDAELWAALRGEPARRTAIGLVSATAIDLGAVTQGRLRGRGNLLAGFRADPDDVRGAAIAMGDVRSPDLAIRRAGVAVLGGLDDAGALMLASGDRGLELAAAGQVHRAGRSLVLDDGRAVAIARAVAVPVDRGAGGVRCAQVTGHLAVSARIAGTLAPRPDLIASGVAGGTGVAVDPDAGRAACAALAGATTAIAADAGAPAALPRRGAARISIAALRSPFVLGITPRDGGDGGGDATPEVSIAGDASATAVAVDDLTVASAQGSFALGVAPELRVDRAHLATTGIRRAGRALGDARIDLARRGPVLELAATARPAAAGFTLATRASLAATGAGYAAALGATLVTLPDGSAWTGHGGAVTVTGLAQPARTRIALDDLALHHGDAVVALSGAYAVAAGDLAVRADADRIDAASIAFLGSGLGGHLARGTGRGTLALARRGGQWQADAGLAVTGLAVAPGAVPIDATAHLGLARGRATLDAHATGPALGDLGLALDTAAPRDPLDPAAWRALDRGSIRSATVTARAVALAGLAGLLGPGVGDAGEASDSGGQGRATGTIDGTVDLAPAALRGGFTVRGVELPAGIVEGELGFAPHDGDLDVRASARLVGAAAAELTARFAVPARPLDPATWRRRGRDLVREARATLGDVAFDPALLARLGLARRLADHGISAVYRGRARAELALGAAAADARLAVELTGVTGGGLAAPISPRLVLAVGPAGSHLRAELSAGELGLGVLEGDVPMTVDRWLDEPGAVRSAPITARWTLPATPLPAVLALLGRRELAAGTLEGSAQIRGTVATPIISSAQLAARDVRFAPRLGGRAAPSLRELSVAARWGGASGTVAVTARQDAGGELRAEASGAPGAPDAATGTATLTRFDLAPVAALLPGALAGVAGTVDGDLALHPGRRVTGVLRVAGGALPVAAAVGTLRDASAELASDGRTITAAVRGRLGRGTIDLSARAPAEDPTAITGELTLDHVSPIAALRPVITARVSGRLHREADRLRGALTIERGAITLPEGTGTPLLDAAPPDDLVLPGASAAARGRRAPVHPWLVLDVQPWAVRLDARDLARGIGALGTLRGDRLEVSIGDTVGLRGRVALESHDVEIFGRRYVIEPTDSGRSGVVFDGTTDPLVNLRMTYQFPDLQLRVDASGRLSQLERPRFSSDPGGYTQDQLFAFFLGAEPSTEAGTPSRDQAREAVAGASTRLLSGLIGKQINKVLPVKVDSLSCEPAPATTATTAASGSCTVGKWLSQQLYLSYRQHLQPRADENTGDAQLQFRLGSRFLLEGTGGDRGYYGADLLWRHRW